MRFKVICNTEIRDDSVFPLRVSCHGDSTILIDSHGEWASHQIPRNEAESICRKINNHQKYGLL